MITGGTTIEAKIVIETGVDHKIDKIEVDGETGV